MARKKGGPRRPEGGRAPEPTGGPAPGRPARARIVAWAGAIVVLVAAALLVAQWPWGGDDPGDGPRIALPPPSATVAVAGAGEGVTTGDFAGSAACASCHASEYATWQRSTHGRAGGVPSAANVIARFDGTPIRFRDAVVIPRVTGGRYEFLVRQEGRDEQLLRVDGVIGGGHMEGGGTQGFVSRRPDGTYRFLPFDFIRKEGLWFCNAGGRGGKGWIPITPSLALAQCGDWPPARVLGDELRYANCQSCHGSQIDVTLDTAARAYRTTFTSLAINCESCHGPGKRHIALVRDAGAVAAGEIGMPPLATLGKDASLGVCWQCHALKDRLRDGHLSGKPLDAYYSTALPQLGDRAHFADGRVRTFGYQEGHLWSDCYVNGGLTCTSCHDPHSQGYRDVTGTPLAGRGDDRQCTSCHQAKGAAVTQHTRHAPGSAGSRCVSCHMPYLQEPEIGTALRYARSDHTIPVPRPAADSAVGVASACKSCHTDRSEQALDRQVADWYGAIKPRAPAIAAALRVDSVTDRRDAAALVLDAREPHTAALFAGMASFAERFLSPDMPDLEREVIERLDALGAHRDLDVRALALGALHLAGGERPSVRRRLASRLSALGAEEALVRSRWTLVLGYFADRQRARSDASGAARAYRKAIEIEPGNPRLHLNLGVSLAEGGEFVPAIASYRQSLALDPLQPLALVNLGIALSATGDKQGAADAYLRATRLNGREALAWFNLGNVYFELGRQGEAEDAYARAAEHDPSLPLAHFYYARALAQRGDFARALQEVETGLQFEPRNEEALAAREQLRRLIAGGRAP